MPNPPVVFAFIIATLCGAIFHLISGGNTRRLALYLLSGWIGFALGHMLADPFSVTAFTIGQVHVLAGVLGALVALIITRILTTDRTPLKP
jgi:uncharacterized membrane protein YeaQ/YmgE (transglycosylase-associated protein family)